ncbi:hypothetical protein KSP40_PGU017822 [Platanthera guangdongensis]|uniref:Uncharacterized protein n=1 Tax=Platanthera guangdongensis TaxID=2320717 RepID=A0ABR2LJD4_9ASPA
MDMKIASKRYPERNMTGQALSEDDVRGRRGRRGDGFQVERRTTFQQGRRRPGGKTRSRRSGRAKSIEEEAASGANRGRRGWDREGDGVRGWETVKPTVKYEDEQLQDLAWQIKLFKVEVNFMCTGALIFFLLLRFENPFLHIAYEKLLLPFAACKCAQQSQATIEYYCPGQCS